MKKVVLSLVAAAAAFTTPVLAADMPVKAAKVAVAPATPVWDIAFGGAVMTDYNFRGISQTDRGPGATAYFEPRFNINPNLQLYAGVQGWTVDLPTAPSAEVDLYAGIRPTWGPLAFDFGALYYYYPRERAVFLDPATGGLGNPLIPGAIPFTKNNTDFLEFYAKVNWTVNDVLGVGAYVMYTDDWLNTGASGLYYGATAKVTLPGTWLPANWGSYISAEVARYALGTTDAFFANVNLPDYTYWNAGVGLTYKVMTVDVRYHDTDLSRANCFLLTGDLRGLPGGGGTAGQSRWCSPTVIGKLSFDLTAMTNLK